MSLLSVIIAHLIILLFLFLLLVYFIYYMLNKGKLFNDEQKEKKEGKDEKDEGKDEDDITIIVIILGMIIVYLSVYWSEILYVIKFLWYGSNILVWGNYHYFQSLSNSTLKHICPYTNIKVRNNIPIKTFNEYVNFYPDPVIFVSNYVGDPLEYFNVGLMEDITLVARDFNQTRYGYFASPLFNKSNFIPLRLGESNYEYLMKETNEHVNIRGKSVFVYPEEPEGRGKYKLVKFKTGIFNIATELDIPIVPIVWDHFHTSYGSVDIKPYKITFGEVFYPSNYSSSGDFMEDIHRWMSYTLQSYA